MPKEDEVKQTQEEARPLINLDFEMADCGGCDACCSGTSGGCTCDSGGFVEKE